MNNQPTTPYLLSLQAYGLNGLASPLVGLQTSPQLGGHQLGKLTGLPIGGGGYQQNLAVSMPNGPLQGIPALHTHLPSVPLSLGAAGVYPLMSHYGVQSSPGGQVPLPHHTILSAGGLANIPKLFVPSVKVSLHIG